MSEYSVEDILNAKRVAREAGYNVSLPKDKVEQAKNVAAAYGYSVKKAPEQSMSNDIETALRTVTDAGYSVQKNRTNNNLPPQPNVPPTTKPAAPAPAPAPAKPPEHEPSWAEKIAAKYL